MLSGSFFNFAGGATFLIRTLIGFDFVGAGLTGGNLISAGGSTMTSGGGGGGGGGIKRLGGGSGSRGTD